MVFKHPATKKWHVIIFNRLDKRYKVFFPLATWWRTKKTEATPWTIFSSFLFQCRRKVGRSDVILDLGEKNSKYVAIVNALAKSHSHALWLHTDNGDWEMNRAEECESKMPAIHHANFNQGKWNHPACLRWQNILLILYSIYFRFFLLQFYVQLKSFLPSLTMWVIATERQCDKKKTRANWCQF